MGQLPNQPSHRGLPRLQPNQGNNSFYQTRESRKHFNPNQRPQRNPQLPLNKMGLVEGFIEYKKDKMRYEEESSKRERLVKKAPRGGRSQLGKVIKKKVPRKKQPSQRKEVPHDNKCLPLDCRHLRRHEAHRVAPERIPHKRLLILSTLLINKLPKKKKQIKWRYRSRYGYNRMMKRRPIKNYTHYHTFERVLL